MMRRYKNKRTGEIIEVKSEINGGVWVPVKSKRAAGKKTESAEKADDAREEAEKETEGKDE